MAGAQTQTTTCSSRKPRTSNSRTRADGSVSACNIEGGNSLLGCSSMVSLYYELGVRWMLFTYNRNNALAGGCGDEDGELTDFGREVLREMEHVGMVVCCSHIGERSAMEIMDLASRPVIFSHSNPGAVWPQARNISDDALRACARTGGVIGINGIGIFLGDNDASTELIARHIDYVVDLVRPITSGSGSTTRLTRTKYRTSSRLTRKRIRPRNMQTGLQWPRPNAFPRSQRRY